MYNYDYNYGSVTPNANDILGGLSALIGIFGLIAAVGSLIMLISTWQVYKKAGKPGWASIVPIYNTIVLIQIVELPMWYIILSFIPIVQIFFILKTNIKLAHKFGKSTGFGIATIFFGIICLPILAFGKNNVYIGNNSNSNSINNTQNPQMTNGNNNFTYDNSTPAGITMFNQNINTNISPQNQINSNMGQPNATIQENNNQSINNGMNVNAQNDNTTPFVYNPGSQSVQNQTTQPMDSQMNIGQNNNIQQPFVYNQNQPTPPVVEQPQQPMQNPGYQTNTMQGMNTNIPPISQPGFPNNNQNNPMM